MEEKQMGEHKSGGLGLGLDINLRLGELTNLVDQLADAVSRTGEKTTDVLAGFVQKMRDAGVGELKSAKEREEEEGRHGEASKLYDRIVTQLQNAAHTGEDTARNLLHDLGEKVEGAGQKTQEFAERDEEQREFEKR